jgi:hypothetical protein
MLKQTCAYTYLCEVLWLHPKEAGSRIDSVDAAKDVGRAWSGVALQRTVKGGTHRMGRRKLQPDFAASLMAMVELEREAESALGARSWRLVSSYGKLMGGPHSGLYVSGVPFDVQREIVRRLAAGETLLIHLMHRHRSGKYESSSLRWSRGELTMVFADREVRA